MAAPNILLPVLATACLATACLAAACDPLPGVWQADDEMNDAGTVRTVTARTTAFGGEGVLFGCRVEAGEPAADGSRQTASITLYVELTVDDYIDSPGNYVSSRYRTGGNTWTPVHWLAPDLRDVLSSVDTAWAADGYRWQEKRGPGFPGETADLIHAATGSFFTLEIELARRGGGTHTIEVSLTGGYDPVHAVLRACHERHGQAFEWGD